jgi:glutamate synthase (NADPH/NADH) small chain
VGVKISDRVGMPELDVKRRLKSFEEVATGYTEEMAIAEASRCLQCPTKPCVSGCPVGIDIPAFIKDVKNRNYESASRTIFAANNLPRVCGRVCPQEQQCEAVCVLSKMKDKEPVAIGRLERFVGDLQIEREIPGSLPTSKRRVAVIGGGPAGITVAADLATKGYRVTIYEAFHTMGGVLVYGIPAFRLPKDIVIDEAEGIASMGVEFVRSHVIGRTLPFQEIYDDHDAVFIGIGAGAPRLSGVPGSNLNNVFSASEFLTRVNLLNAGQFPEYDTPVVVKKKIAVIGAGNVTMDAARTAKRLGAENVTVVYRRSEQEMPARREEYLHAIEEGIEFRWLTLPTEYTGDVNNNISSMRCARMELGPPDESGRRRPEKVDGSEFDMEIEMVIEAIGQKANTVLRSGFPGLELNPWGFIKTDEDTGLTNVEGVYAGGDIVTGAATVIEAMGAGKKAAESMSRYLDSL